jgi:hypothetical protein
MTVPLSRWVGTDGQRWPFVASEHFPGELTLACPTCGTSEGVVLTCENHGRGTGPGGRPRMGDPGWVDVTTCTACGGKAYLPKDGAA